MIKPKTILKKRSIKPASSYPVSSNGNEEPAERSQRGSFDDGRGESVELKIPPLTFDPEKETDFFITVGRGMEDILALEIAEILNLDESEKTKETRRIQRSNGGIYLKGTTQDAYKICLWSSVAIRVLLPLKTFDAATPEKLYGGVKSIRWSDHLTARETLAIDFATKDSQIDHSHFGALKVKDAICDQMRSVQGARPSVDTKNPDIRVNIYLNRDQATVNLDLSGDSLHRRFYREAGTQTEAPMKENLAAAILLLSGWKEVLAKGGEFVDLMCGSGTLPMEAALIATRTAPGLFRRKFGFMKWRPFQPKVWNQLKSEAESMRITDRKKLPRITGYDESARAIRIANDNAERAGLRGLIHFERRDLETFRTPELVSKMPHENFGLVVVNPPYGERLGEVEDLRPLYKALGEVFKKAFVGWKAAVFTGSADLAKEIGLRTSQRYPLFNGPIECRLLTYELYQGAKASDRRSVK